MKRAYRTIAGFLAVIMMVSSFPVLAVTESVWDNDVPTSSQTETTLENSATFDDDVSDISSYESNEASAQEDNASIEDASDSSQQSQPDSNEESTQQQETLDEQESAQPNFDDAQVEEPEVNTENEPTGTAISTAEQLQAIGADETSLAGSYYLTCDIDLAQADQRPGDLNNNFTAIGTKSTPFTGSFDGNGHEIQNLQISTKANYQGLFGYIGEDALVANVGVTGSVSGKSYVGAIAGDVDGSVTNCYNTGEVTGSSDYLGGLAGDVREGSVTNSYNTGEVTGRGNYVGGIAGYVDRSGSITRCYNIGEVIGNNIYGDSVGGVAGEVSNGNVTDCYNTGGVTGKGSYVGGAAGYVDRSGRVTNCYNIGEVTGRDNIGGIAGYVDLGRVKNCYYNAQNPGQATKAIGDGTVSDTVKGLTTAQMIGPQAFTNMVFTSAEGTWTAAPKERADQPNEYGDYIYYYPQLTAFVTDASDLSQFPQWNMHDFEGEIVLVTAYISTAEQLQAMNDQLNGNYVLINDIDLSLADQLPDDENNNFTAIGTEDAPFLGRFDGNGYEIQNLQISTTTDHQGLFGYIGTNSIVTDVGVTGNISGASNVGGVAGDVDGIVTNCYNAGEVTGSGDNIGGVVGYIHKARNVTNCYNEGKVLSSGDNIGGVVGHIDRFASVTNCYNTGKIIDFNENIGGVVGLVDFSAGMKNCYSIGEMIGNGSYVGGVVGQIDSNVTITNCYYNMDTPGWVTKAIGNGMTLDTVKGLTIEEMSGPQAFTNMVFTSTEGTWVASSENDQPNAYGDSSYYYPQLSVFITDASDLSQFPQQVIHDFEGARVPVTKYISTAEQLQEIGLNFVSLTDSYCLTCDIDLAQADQLPDDPNNNFTAIGTKDMPFIGKFDGNGHKIQNLQISTTTDHQGLFGYVGTNSIVTDVGVTGNISGASNVGGVAGDVDGIVTNCYNAGEVTGSGDNIGGVVGYIHEARSVTNCYNEGKVLSSGDNIGGVVGHIDRFGSVTNCYNTGKIIDFNENIGGVVGLVDFSAEMKNCYSIGEMIGNGSYVGGVVGQIDSNVTITNCYYNMDTPGWVTKAIGNGMTLDTVKGLTIEEMSGPQAFTNMVFTSTEGTWVASSENDQLNVYGDPSYYYPQLSVFVTDASDLSQFPQQVIHDFEGARVPVAKYISTAEQLQEIGLNFVSLTDSYCLTCDIDLAQADQLPDDPNNNFTALGSKDTPFIGKFDGNGHEIQNLQIAKITSYQGLFKYIGEDAVVTNVGVTGSISGGYFIGGIVGYVDPNGIVAHCYNLAEVTGKGNYVGGVVGHAYGGSVTDCYNKGNVTGYGIVGGVTGYVYGRSVTNCYNMGIVTGSSCVGGIVGYVDEGSVANCYNTGIITGSADYIGGVGGLVDGSVTNCYYNTENPGKAKEAIGYGTASDTVKGLTIEEMSGPQALTNMVFTSEEGIWVAPSAAKSDQPNAYGDYSYYYPHLTSFVTDASDLSQFPQQVVHDFEGDCVPVTAYISTAEQLQAMDDLLVGNYVLTQHIDLNLADQLPDDENNNFTAIGTEDAPFIGKFDGNGYEIQNLQIATETDYQGLFGYLGSNALIANVGVTGSVFGRSYIGGIAGYTDQAIIADCYNAAAIGTKHVSRFWNFYIGGITGFVDEGSVMNSYNMGVVTINGSKAGGIAGFVFEGSITDCYNTGEVTGSGVYIGGIAGDATGSVTNSYNIATVTASDGYGGGVVGNVKGSLTDCYNTGKVTSNDYYVGGVAGCVQGSATDCYNIGEVTGNGNYVGGVTGCVRRVSVVTNCYNTAPVTDSGDYAGGVVGCIHQTGAVTDCYNTGEVTGNGNYVGGVAGYIYQTGSVTDCYSIAAMKGSDYVGGLVGTIESNGSIADCYCAGKVTGSSQVGNLVGDATGNVTNCYYNVELTDPSVPDFGASTDAVTNVGAKHTMQMTGSNAIGADGMQFSDASAWKTMENTYSLAYYPGLSTIETEQPIGKPYYNISFDVDPDCKLEANGLAPNGIVIQGGHYVFTVSREDLSIPLKVLLNGEEIAPIAIEGNKSIFMIDNVTVTQQVAVVFTQKISGLQISGAETMECGTTQTLTLAFAPGNLTTGNKAVTWSVVEGSTSDVTFSEQTSDNVVIKATQVGDVTVRATSKSDATVYDDFTITITQGAPSVVFPTQAIVDYGQPLSEATFVDAQGEGTFQFKDQDHVAVDEDNGVGYTVVFTPTDLVNYRPVEKEIPLTIRLQITDMSISTSVQNRNASTDELLVMKDSYQQFGSEMQGHGLTAENSLVDWSVTGAESPETVIDQTGKLTISRNETAKVVHISITAKADPTKTATQKVIVCNPGDFDGTMVLNAMDANLLLHQIQQAQQTDYLFNPFYDLNHDNAIDLNDYVNFLKILDSK